MFCLDPQCSGITHGDQTVSRPLGEETDSEDNEEAKEVSSGLEERHIRATRSGYLFKAESFFDFLQLDQNNGIIRIAVGMVLPSELV
jgi:hypothetical protein